LLDEQARVSMPPQPGVWTGKDAVVACWAVVVIGTGDCPTVVAGDTAVWFGERVDRL
jgi:hypothetical protein